MNKYLLLFLLFFSAVAFSQEVDLETIKPPKGKVLVYIVRPSMFGLLVRFDTYCNGFNIGFTKGKSYLFTITDPGKLIFKAEAENDDIFDLNTEADNTYFIKQEVSPGLLKARVNYSSLRENEGRKALKKCNLSKGNLYTYSQYNDFFKQNLSNTKEDVIVKEKIVYVNVGNDNLKYEFSRKSDVDVISAKNSQKPNRFALIIGNEDYSSHQIEMNSEINVDFARNDASAFKDYAENIFGVPSSNIVFLLDATTGQMNQAISKINLIAKNTKGVAEIFVYYAGHGLPDENTKEPYLMPVDVNGKNAKDGIKLKDVYAKLTEFPSKNVTVLIDACFSGGARNQGLVAARGVKVKPKDDLLNGNIVVFTASSGEQSALQYKEKQHGMFTYYFLKKIQETKGDVNYKDLSEYIKDNISLQSVLVNDKEQTPHVIISNSLIDTWGNLKVN